MSAERNNKPAPGSSPENPILLTEEQLTQMLSDKDVKEGAALIDPGSATDVYVESATPRTFDTADGGKSTYNIWGVNAAANDYGTRVMAMGRFLRSEDGNITVVEPPAPETPAPGEIGSRENPRVVPPSTEHFGGYTGHRPSQTPGALYQTGMPIHLNALPNPVDGSHQVPKLHETGDPRDHQ